MSSPAPPLAALAAPPAPWRVVLVMLGIALLLLAVAAMRLVIGSSMGYPTGPHAADMLSERSYRLVLGLIVGVALAVGGVALQALLRNPLAEPFILGLSTGAGLGIMVQWWVVYSLGLSLGASYTGALAGASASMAVVFLASRRRGVLDPLGLLLTGVVLSTICGALIMGFNLLAGDGGVKTDVAKWMMGFINTALSTPTVLAVGGVVAAGWCILMVMGRSMDAATLTDDEAHSVGVNLPRLRVVLFVLASVLAAGAVVLAGPIAFVGLICPHVARLMVGPRHLPLLLASAVLGATLIIAADIASSLIDLRYHLGLLPIGVFTAMLGGPAFLWMLRPQLGRGLE